MVGLDGKYKVRSTHGRFCEPVRLYNPLDRKIFGPRSWNEHREVSATMTEGQLFSRPPEPTSINKYIIFYEIPKFGEVWMVSQKLKSKKSRSFDFNITFPLKFLLLN